METVIKKIVGQILNFNDGNLLMKNAMRHTALLPGLFLVADILYTRLAYILYTIYALSRVYTIYYIREIRVYTIYYIRTHPGVM